MHSWIVEMTSDGDDANDVATQPKQTTCNFKSQANPHNLYDWNRNNLKIVACGTSNLQHLASTVKLPKMGPILVGILGTSRCEFQQNQILKHTGQVEAWGGALFPTRPVS